MAGPGTNISVYVATMTGYVYPQHALRNVNNGIACKKNICELNAIIQHDSYIFLVISIRGVISAQWQLVIKRRYLDDSVESDEKDQE